MDKGYDSESIHRQIREDLHSDSIIPLRSWNADYVGGYLPSGNGSSRSIVSDTENDNWSRPGSLSSRRGSEAI